MAIIDLGTNTCRLFLADVDEAAVTQADRRTTVVRLGQGVDVSRRLRPEAVGRTRDCLEEYTALVRAYAPGRQLLIATSVLRDAADGAAFLRSVTRDFGLPCRVLTGAQEAALAFRGGTAGLAGSAAGPLVLVDIGGGSTEFAIGEPGRAPDHVYSLDVGAVRLTERFLFHDPPTVAELEQLAAFVAATIGEGVPADVRRQVCGAVGVAGTFTTLVAHKLALADYRPELVQGHVLSLADIDAGIALFAKLTSAERGARPGIQPGREDVIVAGAVIAREACRAFDLAGVMCSEADLLEGAALALAKGSLSA